MDLVWTAKPRLPITNHHPTRMTHSNQPRAVQQPQPTPEKSGDTPQKSEDFFVSAVRTFCVTVDTKQGYQHPNLEAGVGNYFALLQAMGLSESAIQAKLQALLPPT